MYAKLTFSKHLYNQQNVQNCKIAKKNLPVKICHLKEYIDSGCSLNCVDPPPCVEDAMVGASRRKKKNTDGPGCNGRT